jgi:hypothetical protein
MNLKPESQTQVMLIMGDLAFVPAGSDFENELESIVGPEPPFFEIEIIHTGICSRVGRWYRGTSLKRNSNSQGHHRVLGIVLL